MEIKKHINDVYFVPGMKGNLISSGNLMEKGYKLISIEICALFLTNIIEKGWL